ncbi:S9 family peptidase [Dictyobacter arantiisoli]|uniref:Acyl-peptide hydrolase n=1 Tax=Dictyobacter arantiisoli TaxID=2014874 RepID=A0A5A5T887_9CHLR|nr:S9 family peptidase [Dictyobacter arantiisoli]GCF07691.1 peptidase S9 [Dictyobacter arantiisoli]
MAQRSYEFERYLNVRTAFGPSFAPDGKRLSFLTNITGVAEVWSVPFDPQQLTPAWPEQLTFRGERVAGAIYSPVADMLLVIGDLGGNESMQFFLLNADGSEWTALTDRLDVMHIFGGWSPDGTRIAYSSNARDPHYFDVYEHDIATGEVRRVLQQDGTNYTVGYSPDGQQILVTRRISNTRAQLLLVDLPTGQIRALTPDPTVGERGAEYSNAAWAADGQGLYVLSNRDRQFRALAYLDLATLELRYLMEVNWDAEHLALTTDGSFLALSTNEDGYSKLELFDVSQGWEQRQLLNGLGLPAGVIYDLCWSQDGVRLALSYTAPDDAMDIYVWDRLAGVITRATQSARGGIPRSAFVHPQLVRYPTFDGREIPAFLYLPQQAQQNIPVVINVHGGPEGQSRPLFDPVTQYFVSLGYAVLAPNVRGSVGYGYDYQSLDDVRLRMDSVADLRAAALWLRERSIAAADKIVVMGGSYGGFMVLSAITTYPDLWAAAVDIVGIANFVSFLENTGPYRRKLREAEYGSLEHDREFLEQISPIRSVDQITAPLFVVHGANDPRVPVGEAEQIVAALRERQVPVEYLRFEDEGHGLIKRSNRLIAYPAIARFLQQYLRLDQ